LLNLGPQLDQGSGAVNQCGSGLAKDGSGPLSDGEARPDKVDWQVAAARLERLRSQGEQFKSQGKYAEEWSCSPSTINKAIRNTPSLYLWARSERHSPQFTGLNEIVTASTPQNREPDPSELIEDRDVDIVFARLLDEGTPEDRARLNAMSRDDRRKLAELVSNDPDMSNKIWH
jgi:hypothetical protein